MKAIRLHSHSGPESFVYEDAPASQPGDGEVLVGVRAAAVTPTELGWVPTWTTRSGEPRPLPIIPGHEFSGDVRAVGAGVADFVVGDTVFGMNDWYGDGAAGRVLRGASRGPGAKASFDRFCACRRYAHLRTHRMARIDRTRQARTRGARADPRCCGRRRRLCRATRALVRGQCYGHRFRA